MKQAAGQLNQLSGYKNAWILLAWTRRFSYRAIVWQTKNNA
jgi:hypothetical protein